MVSAHSARSHQQEHVGSPGPDDATAVKIYTRPFLVSQNFGDGGIREHLLIEVAKVAGLASLGIEAHPRLMRTPFIGQNIVTFKIRPPTPRRHLQDRLVVTYSLTRRDDSAAVQILPGTDGASIRVIMVLNAVGYTPPREPLRRNRSYDQQDIADLDHDMGTAYLVAIFGSVILPEVLAALLKGIETHRYAALEAPPLNHPTPQPIPIDSLRPVHMTIDAAQPFPIAGFIRLGWERFTAVRPPPGPVTRTGPRTAAVAQQVPPPKKAAVRSKAAAPPTNGQGR